MGATVEDGPAELVIEACLDVSELEVPWVKRPETDGVGSNGIAAAGKDDCMFWAVAAEVSR
jgi:hypothetical protein